ncbi:MAG TPA: cytochrome c oxidase subunit II transmembrane domain-containing protein [Tepidisphaeraceae bacterium]|nr:cytochrome c oxidase subunit II transmembrane domain-containing protein [Tepidisphaeraceae bacterium]
MSSPESRPARKSFRACGIGLIALFLFVINVNSSYAGEAPTGWGQWWLPSVRSAHGPAIDSLFLVIFWITMFTFIAVETLLVIFLIKYRNRPEKKKAYFTHGNTKLEMTWTILPAIVLAVLALGSKKVWDEYRYSPASDDPNRALVLAIGQQFKWNFVYPGPDGKLGKYLLFPHPTDPKWPVGADGKDVTFEGVPGPASLPYKLAVAAINKYIDQENPLGKDFADPDGKDDDWAKAPGRGLVLPAHRPIEVQLSSKDVIHDFFLPNFRVKLDALPGMRGHIFFTSNMASSERSLAAAQTIPLDKLSAELDKPTSKDAIILIDESAPGTNNKNKDATGWRYINPSSPRASIIRNGMPFNPDPEVRNQVIQRLKDAGLTEVRITTDPGDWELVCEELCGQGHNTMTAVVTFLSNEDYDKKNLDKPYHPTTAPAQ